MNNISYKVPFNIHELNSWLKHWNNEADKTIYLQQHFLGKDSP